MTRPALFGDFLFEKIPHCFLWLGINSKINFGNLYFLRNHWFYLVFILIWIVLGKLFSYKPFNLPFHCDISVILLSNLYTFLSFTSSLSFLLTSTKELFIYLSILLLCLITYYFFPFFFINVLLLFSMASFGCSFNNFLIWILINSIKFFLN